MDSNKPLDVAPTKVEIEDMLTADPSNPWPDDWLENIDLTQFHAASNKTTETLTALSKAPSQKTKKTNTNAERPPDKQHSPWSRPLLWAAAVVVAGLGSVSLINYDQAGRTHTAEPASTQQLDSSETQNQKPNRDTGSTPSQESNETAVNDPTNGGPPNDGSPNKSEQPSKEPGPAPNPNPQTTTTTETTTSNDPSPTDPCVLEKLFSFTGGPNNNGNGDGENVKCPTARLSSNGNEIGERFQLRFENCDFAGTLTATGTDGTTLTINNSCDTDPTKTFPIPPTGELGLTLTLTDANGTYRIVSDAE